MKLSLAVALHLAILATAAPAAVRVKREDISDADIASKIASESLKSAASMMELFNEENGGNAQYAGNGIGNIGKSQADYGNNMPAGMTPNANVNFDDMKAQAAAHKAEAQKAEAQKTEAHKAEAQKPEAHKAEAQKPEAHKAAQHPTPTEKDDKEEEEKPEEEEEKEEAKPSAAAEESEKKDEKEDEKEEVPEKSESEMKKPASSPSPSPSAKPTKKGPLDGLPIVGGLTSGFLPKLPLPL